MAPIKAPNWAFRILLSLGSVSDIVQLQDLHQTAFMSSLNWDVGRAIKSRKGSFTRYCWCSLRLNTGGLQCKQCKQLQVGTHHLVVVSAPKSWSWSRSVWASTLKCSHVLPIKNEQGPLNISHRFHIIFSSWANDFCPQWEFLLLLSRLRWKRRVTSRDQPLLMSQTLLVSY